MHSWLRNNHELTLLAVSASCPNCGAELPLPPRSARLQACAYCQTTLIVNKGDISSEGTSGQVHVGEALLSVGDRFELALGKYEVLGRAQYSYGRGLWDEFWVMRTDIANNEEIYWLSVDEGDVVIQQQIDSDGMSVIREKADHEWAKDSGKKSFNEADARFLEPGDRLYFEEHEYRVTETEKATCLGFEGSWPEDISIGQTYLYINAEAKGGLLLSCEIDNERDLEPDWFMGRWYSAFDVERAN